MPTLSEADSAALLAPRGIPFAAHLKVGSPAEAVAAAETIGYPVVVKLCGARIAHKTERGLVRVGLSTPTEVSAAATDLLAAATPDDGEVQLLVAELVHGGRELIAGVSRDPAFGLVVMVGVGGILAEAVADVAFRLAPLSRVDLEDAIDDLSSQALLGPFRGEPSVDTAALVNLLMGLSELALDRPDIVSVDLNPLVVRDGKPVAVDALVELA